MKTASTFSLYDNQMRMFLSFFFFKGDLKNKLKKGKLCMNNSKVIANSINHRDYRLDNDYINQNEDDTIRWLSFFSFMESFSFFFFWIVIEDYYYFPFFSFLNGKLYKFPFCFILFFIWYLCSNKSYGSHKNRAFKDESHKGSMDSLDGEEKKDASKEDLEQEEGK